MKKKPEVLEFFPLLAMPTVPLTNLRLSPACSSLNLPPYIDSPPEPSPFMTSPPKMIRRDKDDRQTLGHVTRDYAMQRTSFIVKVLLFFELALALLSRTQSLE